MPPKEKVSKAKVSSTAFEMTREYGFASVTARKLAERLGCSTQPIFRAYENMDELRAELFYMSVEDLIGRMIARKGKTPSYMAPAMEYIEFAKSEKNLFELIASVDDFGTRTIDEFLKTDEGSQILTKITGQTDMTYAKKKELFTMFWMFVHGMAALISGNRVEFTDREIRAYITKAYEGFINQIG
ncbi:MAG: TetR/AcrR family transcriptional regulator [Lachnospiraceae bacterium]|nr:TetR/AcrR family transcriptional regulator [Lachnospiraceae bacterium]